MVPMRTRRLAVAFLVVVFLVAAIDIAARGVSAGTGISATAIDASLTGMCFLAYPWISPVVLSALAKEPPPSPALDQEQLTQLTVTAQRLAAEAGIKAPRLVMIDDAGHIAFGVGMPSRSTIFITQGLSSHVSTSTLEGILAHEIGHIRSRHTFFQAFVFAGLFASKTLIGIPAVLAPIIMLGYLAVLRQCEFAADRCAAKLVGSDRTASTLSELRDLVQERIVQPNPLSGITGWLKDGFSTHPSFARRIASIRGG
jgi:Zn-dependent protease with chaperone function